LLDKRKRVRIEKGKGRKGEEGKVEGRKELIKR
jgi:hypothetical protein